MMTSMIKSVTDLSDRYCRGLWTYRTSGNMLELTVKPDYPHQPDTYRQAIICTGMVLQALDTLSAQQGNKIFIQSFPNLQETRLVAVARILKLDDEFFQEELKNPLLVSETSLVTLLSSIASHQGFFLKPARPEGIHTVEAEQLFSSLSLQPEEKSLYTLSSTTDNPFVWLKTGYWLERVYQITSQNPDIDYPVMIVSLPGELRSQLHYLFDDCPYSQALILL